MARGKAQLSRFISGVVQRDSGEILLFGKPCMYDNPGSAIASGIGMVFQELSLIPDLRVSQNIFLELEPQDKLMGTSRKALRERTYDIFDQMGIDVADPDRNINELTLTQRQMVEITKVIARNPHIIIFDEATSALGRAHANWLVEFSRKLAAQGKIIIFISHKLSEIRDVADQITVFRNGMNVGTFGCKEKSVDEVVNLMLGRVMGRLYPLRRVEIFPETSLDVKDLKAGARLKGVSFHLRKGEIVGIGGLTGQGQEELFRALFGVQHSDGIVKLEDRSVSIEKSQCCARERHFFGARGSGYPGSVAAEICF